MKARLDVQAEDAMRKAKEEICLAKWEDVNKAMENVQRIKVEENAEPSCGITGRRELRESYLAFEDGSLAIYVGNAYAAWCTEILRDKGIKIAINVGKHRCKNPERELEDPYSGLTEKMRADIRLYLSSGGGQFFYELGHGISYIEGALEEPFWNTGSALDFTTTTTTAATTTKPNTAADSTMADSTDDFLRRSYLTLDSMFSQILSHEEVCHAQKGSMGHAGPVGLLFYSELDDGVQGQAGGNMCALAALAFWWEWVLDHAKSPTKKRWKDAMFSLLLEMKMMKPKVFTTFKGDVHPGWVMQLYTFVETMGAKEKNYKRSPEKQPNKRTLSPVARRK